MKDLRSGRRSRLRPNTEKGRPRTAVNGGCGDNLGATPNRRYPLHAAASSSERLSATPVEQHHAFTVVRTFLRWAHRKHYLNTNPMDRMKSDHRYKPRARVLSDAELKKVWNAAGDDTFGTIVKLLILTGQRVGEVSRLSPDMTGTGAIMLPSWLAKNGREHTFHVGTATVPRPNGYPIAWIKKIL